MKQEAGTVLKLKEKCPLIISNRGQVSFELRTVPRLENEED